ncbi:MAG: hypothetical protein SV108_01390, partial [Pseudomonadota bacterium]|nr:hypothetical protein [Pseudomonadota bacterium]
MQSRHASALAGLVLLTGVPVAGAVIINEALVSMTGVDDAEYIELFGAPDTALAGLSIIGVEGDAGSGPGGIDFRYDFPAGAVLGPNGFLLLGNPTGLARAYAVTPDLAIGANSLENSSVTLALVQTASLTGGSVSGGEVVLDAFGLTDGDAGDIFFFAAPVIGPDGSFFPAGARRLADGLDTDTPADFVFADFNLGPANTPVSGGTGAGGESVPIYEIQGAGVRAALAGETITTTGVVTALAGRDFWLQDPQGDADPQTSDGILVDLPGNSSLPAVAVGDAVELTAVVDEQQFGDALPRTRLTGVSALTVVATGTPLPAPVALTDLPDESLVDGIDFWERLEGMRVSLTNGVVVAPTTRFGEFAAITPADARALSGYLPTHHALRLRPLGENVVDYNPERILIDDATLQTPPQVVPGDRVRQLIGVVDYTFGNYKLQPTSLELDIAPVPTAPVSERGPAGRDATRITSWNVENLFDLQDAPGKDDGSSTPSAAALETQLAKLALALRIELELPAVLIVQEVENTAILQTLGDRVNAAAGTAYTATSFETSDGRGIEVGFLWDADRVELLEAFQLAGPAVSAAFGPQSASPGREPLVGRFRIGGAEVTIIGNHFKSKGGDGALFGATQPPVRVTEEQRKAQARAVRDYVDQRLASDPAALLMVAGDLNDFQFGEPGEGGDHPVAILEGTGRADIPLYNLVRLERPDQRYTFVFDGNSQVLDHMLVSPALLKRLRGVDILHFNAGWPDALGDLADTPLRAADHDAVEGRFHLGPSHRR